MATVKNHYQDVLSEVYSWMFGGLESGIKRNEEFISRNNLIPQKSKIAVDLGSGCGFQSIPLARLGYTVTAIDLDEGLLNELKNNSDNLPIRCLQSDIIDFDRYVDGGVELIVCMTDTLLHLDSKEKVNLIFHKVFSALLPGGRLVITFRDLSHELKEAERFLPVKNDENIIFTCFLEYEPETVNVYDVVYKRSDNGWDLFKSFYRKLRLSNKWVVEQLSQTGFNSISSDNENGIFTIIATK